MKILCAKKEGLEICRVGGGPSTRISLLREEKNLHRGSFSVTVFHVDDASSVLTSYTFWCFKAARTRNLGLPVLTNFNTAKYSYQREGGTPIPHPQRAPPITEREVVLPLSTTTYHHLIYIDTIVPAVQWILLQIHQALQYTNVQ